MSAEATAGDVPRPSNPAKLVMDVTVAGLALLFLAPMLVCIAVLVRLDSRGPALYRQQRVGKDGRLFWILKFRSMVVDQDPGAVNVSAAGDPRVTRIGRYLREYYLDELPQLVNVVKGDMSLVGPRPETPEFVERYTPGERRVLAVRPGLVGPSTLGFMDEAERLAASPDPVACYEDVLMHERVQLDLQYLAVGSLRYDVALLSRQALAILRTCRPAGPSKPTRRTGRAALTGLLTGAILVVSLGVDIVPGNGGAASDFVAHAVAYGLLTTCLLAFGPVGLRQAKVLLVLGVGTLGALLEIAQLTVGRDAQWADVLANFSGAAAAAFGWGLVRRLRDRQVRSGPVPIIPAPSREISVTLLAERVEAGSGHDRHGTDAGGTDGDR